WYCSEGRSAGRDHIVLGHVWPVLHPDHLTGGFAPAERAVRLTDARSVRPEGFEEQVGVVGQPGGHAPGGEPVVPDPEPGGADEPSPGRLPLGAADVREVPRRRGGRGQVRVAGQDGLTRGGAAAGDGPVVRTTAAGQELLQGGEIGGQRVENG